MPLSGTCTRRVLSGIERLPTEVVQQIASWLIIEIPHLDKAERPPNEPRLFRPGKLATLRAASRVLRAKTEYIFKQCFAVKVVPFHKYSLHRLYQLSLCPVYATLVKELSFVPHSVSVIKDDWQDNDKWALDAAMADSKVAQLRSKHAEETSFLILALNGFDNLMAIEVSPDLQQPTSANVRRHSVLSHSPTKIMAAIMESKSHLKSLAFVDSQARAGEGLTPRIFSRPSADVGVFNNLKTLALTLTCRNLGPRSHHGLSRIIKAASSLERLSLALDRPSLVEKGRGNLSNGSDVFIALATATVPRLRHCELKGWDLVEAVLQGFLHLHRNILHELRLVDCIVVGAWRNALEVLLGSETLQTLYLHQLGQNFRRICFPHTCEVYTREIEVKDRTHVYKAVCTARIALWQKWDYSLNALIQDIRRTREMVDPKANDAVAWYGLPLA